MSSELSMVIQQISDQSSEVVADRIAKRIESGGLRKLLSELASLCASTTKSQCSRLMSLIPRLSVESAIRSDD